MGFCDLHIHSCYSDGTFTPTEIVEKAKEKNLCAISITDHDEIYAIGIAKSYGEKNDILVISGIELSAMYNDTEIHILGYLFDEDDKKFSEKLKEIREYREERAKKILRKLEDYGFHINFNFVKDLAGQGAIGRPHVAQALLENKNINEYKDAFVKYIGNGKPCNVPKYRLNPKEAIELITDAGGIPVLAHPGNIRDDGVVDEVLRFPFGGLEVWHPDHTSRQIKHYLSIAEERSLLTTGGSDNHGHRSTKAPIGGIVIDFSAVESLINYKDTHL